MATCSAAGSCRTSTWPVRFRRAPRRRARRDGRRHVIRVQAGVFVGDLVSFYADIVKLGTTSITVDVEVYVERNRLEKEVVKVTEATLVYVATDEQRKPRPLPPL